MVTNSIGRRVALVLVLAVGSVTPCLAKVSGEDFTVEGGLVRGFVDDFTDAYQSSFLLINGEDGANVRVNHLSGGEFQVTFFDQEREYDLPDDGADVEVVFRVDSLEAVTLTASWWTRHNLAWVAVPEVWVEELADMVLGAETILYRIGSRGEVLRVRLPAELPEMIAEFQRRVAEATMASGDE